MLDSRWETENKWAILYSGQQSQRRRNSAVDQEAVDQAMIQACISVVLRVKRAEPKQENVGNNSFTRGKL